MIMRASVILLFCAAAVATNAQRPELGDAAAVRDSVLAQIGRDRAEGLWTEALASGELHGSVTLDMVIDDKGRCESVFVVESDLPIKWKNAVKDKWFDRRFNFKLAKFHKEKITIALQFP